jgi:hypothetical protein
MSQEQVKAGRASLVVMVALVTTALAQAGAGSNVSKPTATAAAAGSAALAAIEQAAAAGKYIYLFCYRDEDEHTRAARATLDAAMEKLADRAMSVAVHVDDPQERLLVAKYQLNRAPLPLVLAVAPTGAVTGGFPGTFTAAQLETALVSRGAQKCLKALQDRKLVLLCVQNGATQHNAEALRGVREFAADPQYAATTEIVSVDPTDPAEESLLKQFKVDPQTAEAVTVFLAPPGAAVATYTGATDKDVLVAAARTAARGCNPASGCCGPRQSARTR